MPTANFVPLVLSQVTVGAASCVSVAVGGVKLTFVPVRSVVVRRDVAAPDRWPGPSCRPRSAPVAVAAAEPPVIGRMTFDALVSTVTTAPRVPATPIE